ncbi:M60 family metallopeptidase [Arachidicoccus soli]|uniref:Peptidase M60 domain-containing protein n=1 Tax=Arachidicoccus soli TaxID=2341117 RepID=A0A386HSS4_9BACT|nr:M60 family metallopeptidase [Arachidicoccus soli]AYD48511.1 hypothetical protein D6B99_13410 [Arachidicoccus soli]
MKMCKSKTLLKVSNVVFCLMMMGVLSISSCKKSRFDVPDGYTVDSLKEANINVDTTDTKPDFSFLPQARLFPGLVGVNERRIADTVITMDLNYNDIRNSLRISVVPQPWKPTGLYAPAGEPITITLPLNAVGITAQIGCWTDNLSSTSPRKREPIIFTVKKLFPGENHIRGPFGGQIFLIPEIPLATPITFHVSGACREPDFHLGITDPAKWKQEIMTTSVPWFDFDSKHMAFSLPTKVMVNYLQSHPSLDINAASQAWDDIINYDYDAWEGLSDTAVDKIDQPTNLPWRVVLDIQPSVGYGHNGYPVVATDDNEWFNAAFTGGDTTGNLWGTLHELGHNNQQQQYWDWSTLGETSNNLHSFKRANRMGIQALAVLHPAFTGGAASAQAKALAYVNKTGTKNFDADAAINDPFERMIPFLQIFNKLKSADGTQSGWDFWPFLYRRARHALRPSNNDIDKHDFFYEALCDYTGLDCILFFRAWGINLSGQATTAMSQAHPTPLLQQIWTYDPIAKTGGDVMANSRALWNITSIPANDFQSSGENTGLFSALIDGNPVTYWHSSYGGTNGSRSFPHTLMLDMYSSQLTNGVYFIQRAAGSRNVKSLKVWVGNDVNNLTLITPANATLLQNSNQQNIALPTPQSIRYIKIEFDNAWDGQQFAAMAEIGTY